MAEAGFSEILVNLFQTRRYYVSKYSSLRILTWQPHTSQIYFRYWMTV